MTLREALRNHPVRTLRAMLGQLILPSAYRKALRLGVDITNSVDALIEEISALRDDQQEEADE